MVHTVPVQRTIMKINPNIRDKIQPNPRLEWRQNTRFFYSLL